MKKVSNIIYYLICVYIIILPIFNNNMGIVGKFPDVVLMGIIIIYILYSLSSKNNIKKLFYNVKEFSTSFLGIGMIFLTLIMIISTVYALEKSLAIKESFRFITYIALLFIIKYEIEEDSKIKNIIKCIVVITSILCIFGIVQYFTKIGLNPIFVSSEGTRITSTMENPNGFGAYLILSFFPIFMLSFDRINKKRRMVFIGISLLMVVNIFFTYSRNATVGFAIGIVILAILYNYKILGIFLVIIPVFFMDTSLIHRFSNMKISVLNDPRIKLWKVAIKMIKDHPIMGVGNGNYVALYDTYIAKYRYLAYKDYHRFSSHNSYLKVQSELGIFGITSFIFVIIGTIRSIIKVYKNTEDNTYKVFFMGMMASVIAFLVMNLLDNLFFSPQTTTYFWIFIAISENIVFRHNKKKIEV